MSFLGLWGLLETQGDEEGNGHGQKTNRDDDQGHNRKNYQSELEDLKRIKRIEFYYSLEGKVTYIIEQNYEPKAEPLSPSAARRVRRDAASASELAGIEKR